MYVFKELYPMKPSSHKGIKAEYNFFLLLVALGLLYNYHEILFMRPCGIHQWRSCVSAAFPVNYYYGGSFLTTQTNALLADGLSSDVTVVEFPLIYYIISLFYRVFGVNELWFRLVQVSIGFAGLIYLFKATYLVTRDQFYAGVLPLIIFTSPVYVFYLNGFIPDSVALSLTFGGLYYFLKFSENKRFRSWLVSMLFFLLAGITKTSSLLPYFGLGGVAVLDLAGRLRKPGVESMFVFKFRYIISYLAVMALIVAWYYYAKVYSEAHGGSVSAVEIRPIWRLDQGPIQDSWNSLKKWFNGGIYHYKYFLILSLLVFLGMLPFYKKADRFWYRLSILVFLGAFAFTMLFFRSMRDHDYYQINNLFLLVSIYLSLFAMLANIRPKLMFSPWTKVLVGIVLLVLVLTCDKKMKYRYSFDDWHYWSSMNNIARFDIEPYLEELGIDRSAKVHCTPDQSINISLYLCNRKGFTDFWPYGKLPLDERVVQLKKAGIEYVIIGNRENFPDIENLDEILGEKIGQTGTTEIFRLSTDE